jgi:ferredoxin-NADP reductase
MKAERKKGRVVAWRSLSEKLAIFRVEPEPRHAFPRYKAGQYCALARTGCRLTKRVVDADGRARYIPDLDEDGIQRRGTVTHSYSIASAPFETAEDGHLEFYVILEKDEQGRLGRLTESLFQIQPQHDDEITYVSRIVGDFTLDRRTQGAKSVVFVGTGTGLAPFAAMLKQLDHEARRGHASSRRFTLLHANHTRRELAYHAELLEIERAGRYDFEYVATESRPTGKPKDGSLGHGRASNVLRLLLGMPTREEQVLREAVDAGAGVDEAKAALVKAVTPTLPSDKSLLSLRRRLQPAETVVLTCGSPGAMADVARVAAAAEMRFEKEDW